jgi:hypothetical protein
MKIKQRKPKEPKAVWVVEYLAGGDWFPSLDTFPYLTRRGALEHAVQRGGLTWGYRARKYIPAPARRKP